MIVTAHNRARRHLRRLSKHSFPSYRVYEGEPSVCLLSQTIEAYGLLLGFGGAGVDRTKKAISTIAALPMFSEPFVSPGGLMRTRCRTAGEPCIHSTYRTLQIASRGKR